MIQPIHGYELQPISEASKIHEMEEIEISKLASHCDPLNPEGWTTAECHECLAIETIKGTQRELAEKLYNAGWMIYQGQTLCRECQDR